MCGGAGLSESFPVCAPYSMCVRPGQGKYAQNVCHKDNVCVFCLCPWQNVLLSHCKAMPHRDRFQGHTGRGGGVGWDLPSGMDQGSHSSTHPCSLPSDGQQTDEMTLARQDDIWLF